MEPTRDLIVGLSCSNMSRTDLAGNSLSHDGRYTEKQ